MDVRKIKFQRQMNHWYQTFDFHLPKRGEMIYVFSKLEFGKEVMWQPERKGKVIIPGEIRLYEDRTRFKVTPFFFLENEYFGIRKKKYHKKVRVGCDKDGNFSVKPIFYEAIRQHLLEVVKNIPDEKMRKMMMKGYFPKEWFE